MAKPLAIAIVVIVIFIIISAIVLGLIPLYLYNGNQICNHLKIKYKI